MATDQHRLALNVHRSSRSDHPTVHIFLQRVVRQANGMLAVTPVCSSLPEIEGEIEDLRNELEEVLQQARVAYGTKRASAVGRPGS
jgi:hypothetical protein